MQDTTWSVALNKRETENRSVQSDRSRMTCAGLVSRELHRIVDSLACLCLQRCLKSLRTSRSFAIGMWANGSAGGSRVVPVHHLAGDSLGYLDWAMLQIRSRTHNVTSYRLSAKC